MGAMLQNREKLSRLRKSDEIAGELLDIMRGPERVQSVRSRQ